MAEDKEITQTIDDKLKEAQIKKENQNVLTEKRRILNEDDKVIIAKVEVLRCLMLGEIIDESKSIIGGSPVMLNLFNEGEFYVLKGKVMELIKKF